MKQDNHTKHINAAQEALRSFLATLLGTEAPLRINGPVPLKFEDANIQSKAYLVLSAGKSKKNRFAIMLDPRWLPLLSKSMLGEPIEIGEPGADDLLRELAAQAYGTLRTQLSSVGVTLAEVHFELMESGSDLDSNLYNQSLQEISFNMMLEGESLGGFAMLPVVAEAEAKPESQALSGMNPSLASQIPSQVNISPASFPDLGNEQVGGDGASGSFRILAEVELEITVELGRRKLPLADVLRLTTGSVIELEKLVGEPLEVYANGRFIAEGEAVVIDEQFGIRVTNLVSNRQRARAFL